MIADFPEHQIIFHVNTMFRIHFQLTFALQCSDCDH